MIVGVLLAGGQSRRMGGGDKSLNDLAGQPLLAHVVKRALPQVDTLILNANGDPERFSDYSLPVVGDTVEGFVGPLAGVLTGQEWARDHAPDAKWVVTMATDTPFFPADLVTRFKAAIKENGADMAMATSGGNRHPVFGMWPVELADDLRHALTVDGVRKVLHWTDRFNLVQVDFSTHPYDPFFNVNRPQDLQQAQKIMRENSD
jgi:molybdenum cofactor guanylyltransferase